MFGTRPHDTYILQNITCIYSIPNPDISQYREDIDTADDLVPPSDDGIRDISRGEDGTRGKETSYSNTANKGWVAAIVIPLIAMITGGTVYIVLKQ